MKAEIERIAREMAPGAKVDAVAHFNGAAQYMLGVPEHPGRGACVAVKPGERPGDEELRARVAECVRLLRQ